MLNFLAEYINEHCDFNDERQSGKVKYQISTIFILVFIGLLCSYTNILSISYFIKRNKKTFQKYELLKNNEAPGKTTYYRLLNYMNWEEIKNLSQEIYDALPEYIKLEVSDKNKITKILDGKFIISSKRGRKRGYNIVTLFDPNTNLPIDMYCVNTHDSEKNALPKLIETLNAGDIISDDAIYCDNTIINLLIKKNIDFTFSLKKNNKDLLKVSKEILNNESFIKDQQYYYEKKEYTEIKNGYIIKKTFEKIDYANEIEDIITKDGQKYKGIRTCVKRTIEKIHKKTGKKTKHTIYFISSLFDFDTIIKTINEHWLIESYHWHLDMVLDEDHCSVSNKNVAMILNIIRKLVLLIIEFPMFKYKCVSKKDRLKINLENIDICINKLIQELV